MKHFTGLSSLQFNVLFEFLNDICPLDELTYWSCNAKKLSKVSCKLPEWSSKKKLFICLLRLKKRFYNKNPVNTVKLSWKENQGNLNKGHFYHIYSAYVQIFFDKWRNLCFPLRNSYRNSYQEFSKL